MTAAETRIAAVILNWKRPDDTLACVRSVAALDHALTDIVVCDNASPDGSYDAIARGLAAELEALNQGRQARGQAAFTLEILGETAPPARVAGEGPRISLIQTGRNGGYAFGNNVGVRVALADPEVAFVWILNNDTEVARDGATALLRRMTEDPSIGICGPRIVYLGAAETVQCLGGGHFLPWRARCELIGGGTPASAPVDPAAVERQLDYVSGAAAFVRRAFIETVGLMDEGYFLYWEEIDWATRGAGRYRLGYCDEAVVHHAVGASIGTSDSGASSLLADYYMVRSRMRFLRRFHLVSMLIAIPLVLRDGAREASRGHFGRAGNLLAGAFFPVDIRKRT